jgi:hypothetical protein
MVIKKQCLPNTWRVARIAVFFAVGRNAIGGLLRKTSKDFLEFTWSATVTRNVWPGRELGGVLWLERRNQGLGVRGGGMVGRAHPTERRDECRTYHLSFDTPPPPC